MDMKRCCLCLLALLLLLCACGTVPAENPQAPATSGALPVEEPQASVTSDALPVEDPQAPATSDTLPTEEPWPPVLSDPLPAIDWSAIPLGSPEKETLAALGWERDVEDTSPREGADSFVDSDRFAPLRSYVFNQNTPFDTKPDYLKVTLCGALVEHVSVGCRGGIVHYVSYNFLSGYFADRDAYWAAAQTLRQGLGEALAETAEFVGERYDAEKLNAEEFKEPYIAHWVHGDYRLEMEVWTNFIVLRLRYFPYYD